MGVLIIISSIRIDIRLSSNKYGNTGAFKSLEWKFVQYYDKGTKIGSSMKVLSLFCKE